MGLTENKEIGNPLSVDDLRARLLKEGPFIVATRRVDREVAATLWFTMITENFALFRAGWIGVTMMLMVRGDTLVDDTGQIVFVNEYLGEP